MNRHILTVIDHQLNPGKYTQEELEENSNDAFEDSEDADYLAKSCQTATYAANHYDDPKWVQHYFDKMGENKQDYIDAINKDK